MLESMRRIVWAFALPLLPLACFDPGTPTTLDFDAGALPPVEFPDATALPNVAIFSPEVPQADGGPIPEAGPVDVGVDGQPPMGTVTVLVVSDFGPEATVQVVASDAVGNVLGTGVRTDATGSAQLTIPAGASVTAVLTNYGYNSFVTYAGVSPGDALTVYDTTEFRYASLNVNVYNPPDNGGGFVSAFMGDCSFSLGPTSYTGYPQPGCFLAGNFPILVLAPPTSYSFQKGNSLASLADGGGSTVSPDLGSVLLETDGAYQTVSASNPPAPLAPLPTYLSYAEVANNVPYWVQTTSPTIFVSADGGPAPVSAQFPTHPKYPDFVQTQAQVFALNDSQNGPYWSVVKRSAAPTAGDALDLSGLSGFIAGVGFEEYVGAGGVAVAWSTVGSVPGDVGTLVHLTSGCGDWTFVAPPGATSVAGPQLPSQYNGIFSGECALSTFDVATLSGSAIADYAHLKAAAGPMMNMMDIPRSANNNCGGFSAPPLPTDGTLTITGYQTGMYSVCNPP
jgi:hypothetical protein